MYKLYFDEASISINRFKIKQKGKFSMVDVYLSLACDEIIKSFDHSASSFIDVGKPESVALAGKLFP